MCSSDLEPPRPAPAAAPTPRHEPPSGWQAAHVGTERDGLLLDGLDVWATPWQAEAGPALFLPHPAHPSQRHSFTVYSINDGSRATRFAAAELSNGVWGFYRWIVPGDAPEGHSSDGSLRYTHDYGELVNGRYDAVSPVATLHDARTGEPLFDGKAWFASRVVPRPDGSLHLLLEQGGSQTLFRINAQRGSFHDVLKPEAERPLRELAEAGADAHREISEKTGVPIIRRLAPDGSLVVELQAVEWSNSHWVYSPRLAEVATGRILLDLWGTDWDAVASFPQDWSVRLALRSYRSGAGLSVELDCKAGRFAIEGRTEAGPIDQLPAMLAQMAAGAARRAGATRPRIERRALPRAYGVALLILLGALLAIAAATLATLRFSPSLPPQVLDRVPAMPKAFQRVP